MKKLLKVSLFVLPAWFAIFMSCSRDSSLINSPPPPQPFLDTLTGREFEFNDLTWREFPSSGPDIIIEIRNRPDLFYYYFRLLKVTIRLDTSAVWMDVFQYTGAYNAGPTFYHTMGSDFFYASQWSLYIFSFPVIPSLKGTKVAVRIKFI